MSAARVAVTAPEAPQAVGPYVHAVAAGGLLFCSGQVPLDPASGGLVAGSIGDQTRRCLENLDAVCREAGTSLRQAVRVGIYVTDMSAFGAVNEAYGAWFAGDDPPARSTIGVASLPLGAPVEIDAVVALGPG